jgi:type IV pilus assembly protein PilM
MEFLPRTLGTRPRLACEVRAEGIVAARAEDASGVLSAVSRIPLADGLAVPQLRMGIAPGAASGAVPSSAGRAAVVAAVRKALEAVALRSREVTLVVPDAAVRVLLLDFDALPGKPAEALPVVRFRLKKLLPFDADDAAVSYQVMSTSKGIVRVVAVAMPREVLAEYESVVREAGFEPGAILPSTLAALAGLSENDAPVLVVNAGRQAVTTAIVKAGVLLLHRTVDLGADLNADFAAANLLHSDSAVRLPLVDRADSAEEWSRPESAAFHDPTEAAAAMQTAVLEHEMERETAQEIEQEIAAERGLAAATSEVAQAVSVAAAYFEDTLERAPGIVLATGTMGAQALGAVLEYAGVGPVTVEEIVNPEMLGPGSASAGPHGRVPPGWLAGVRGALAD